MTGLPTIFLSTVAMLAVCSIVAAVEDWLRERRTIIRMRRELQGRWWR